MIDSQPRTWLRIDGVLKKTSTSRAWFLDEVSAGRAPAPLKISAGISVWPEAVIDAWMAEREAKAAAHAGAPPVTEAMPGGCSSARSSRRGGRPRKGSDPQAGVSA